MNGARPPFRRPGPSASSGNCPHPAEGLGFTRARRLERADERRRERAERRPVISPASGGAGLSAITDSRAGSQRRRRRRPGQRARRFPRSARAGGVLDTAWPRWPPPRRPGCN